MVSLATSSLPFEQSARANSFFKHLNYDFRRMIYDFLELPPVSNECAGLILSCRIAQLEIEAIADQSFNKFLTDVEHQVERARGVLITVPRFKSNIYFLNLNEVQVIIPTDQIRHRHRTLAIMRGIYPLLRCWLDQVTIALDVGEADECQVEPEDSSFLFGISSIIYQVRALENIIAKLASGLLLPGPNRPTDFLSRDVKSPSLPLRAKRIVVTWGEFTDKIQVHGIGSPFNIRD